MVGLYFPRNWRHHKALLIMMAVELPFTIVILTLTGIASHDLYRTRLWQDGADNGFNSAPDEAVYAAANYRPYTPPMVWSSLYVFSHLSMWCFRARFADIENSLTKYNLVLGVLSTFFLITKAPVHMLRVFYPLFSVFIHVGLAVLYIVSARYQGGSDMSDPRHPQSGPPWYITKSCGSAAHRGNIGYCKQAKALFAFTILMMCVDLFVYYLAIANQTLQRNLCRRSWVECSFLLPDTRRKGRTSRTTGRKENHERIWRNSPQVA